MNPGFAHIRMVVVGGSAGSFGVVKRLLSALPAPFPLPLLFGLHRLKNVRSGLVESLEGISRVALREPEDKEVPKAGVAYLAPANYHLLVEPSGNLALSIGPEVHFSRPSIDLLFESAAHAFGRNMLAIMLSGANEDGADGMALAHRKGAVTLVQDPDEALVKTMPTSCLKRFTPTHVLGTDELIKFIEKLVS